MSNAAESAYKIEVNTLLSTTAFEDVGYLELRAVSVKDGGEFKRLLNILIQYQLAKQEKKRSRIYDSKYKLKCCLFKIDIPSVSEKAKKAKLKNTVRFLNKISYEKDRFMASITRISALKVLEKFEEDENYYDWLKELGLDGIVSLARKASEAKLVPEDLGPMLVKNLSSVDSRISGVPWHLSAPWRYFMMYVKKTIENNPDCFEDWSSLLPCHQKENVVTLFESLKQEFVASAFPDSSNDREGDETEISPILFFEQKHVPALTELLSMHSSKWRELGIALWLTMNELDSIESELHKVIRCLHGVIHSWVMRKVATAKPPTLANLENALRSETVSLGVVANSLKDNLNKKGIILSDGRISSYDKKKDLRIIRQSYKTEVAEGKCALLEVKIPSGYDAAYQWYKDGEMVPEFGNEAILCVKADNLTVEGTYSCTIEVMLERSDKVLVSNDITLSVETPLDEHRKKLCSLYTDLPEVPKDTWPPKSNNTYINLALINEQQGIEEKVHYTIQGNADNIFMKKESVPYEKAFDNINSGSRVLIVGRPGSGKSTLVHKISQDWAKDKLKFGCVRLLFLIHLRRFRSDPNIDLSKLMYHYESASARDSIMSYADKHAGLGFCFLLDGLDEYMPENDDAYIFKLIEKACLPNAVVMVASRPIAIAEFRFHKYREIEVLGFLKEQISDYIKGYNFTVESKRGELKDYLNHHPNVHHMCYLPIHAAMVCFLFEQDSSSIPETETGIYKEFTKATVLRILSRHNKKIKSIKHLPPKIEGNQFLMICKVAFKMCVDSKQVIKEDEVDDISDALGDKDFLGLITVDRMAEMCGFEDLYSFLHLTFQEFLAAFHIAYLEEKEQTDLIKTHVNSKELQNVWKFFCGLVKSEDQCAALLQRTPYETLYKVQCSFESQKPSLCHTVVKDHQLYFKEKFITPSDFTAIAYVISNATQQVVHKLVFNHCTLGEEGIDVLKEKAGENQIHTLIYHGHTNNPPSTTSTELKSVNKLVHALPYLEVLDITSTYLGTHEVKALTEGIHHSNLQIMKIDAYRLVEEDFKYLIKCFMSKCEKFNNVWFSDRSKIHLSSDLSLPFPFYSVRGVTDVNLSGVELQAGLLRVLSDDFKSGVACNRISLISCGIDDEGAKILADGIKNSCLKVLELNLNHISDGGALALAKCIKAQGIESDNSLHTLNLSCNDIGNKGALNLARAAKAVKDFNLMIWNNRITKQGIENMLKIKPDIRISTLELDCRYVSESVVAAIISRFTGYLRRHDFSSLLTVNLSDNCIGDSDSGIKVLPDILRETTNLQSLNLSNNSITDNGAKLLFSNLKNYNQLSSLNLSSNSITDESIEILTDALKNCTCLNSLNLSSNSISDDGTEALFHALKNCTELASLDLASNKIRNAGIKCITQTLMCFKNLNTLNLSNNMITHESIEDLAVSLRECHHLRELDLSRNSIGSDGAKALFELLGCCKNLLSLDVSYNSIGESGIAGFSFPHLHTLKLGGNCIGDGGALHLAHALENCISISSLDIHDNGIGCEGTKAIIDALRSCNSVLEKVSMDLNNVGDDDIKDTLQSCKHLNSLCLTLNEFEYHCGYNRLQDLKPLHSLKLRKCDIEGYKESMYFDNLHTLHLNDIHSYDSIHHLLGACRTNLCTLQIRVTNKITNLPKFHIDCGLNNLHTIDTNFIENLGDFIFQNSSSLCVLNVEESSLCDDGAKELAGVLMHCNNLQVLNISGNSISLDGITALAVTLKHSIKLSDLDVSKNHICSRGAKILANSLQCCVCLHTLRIDDNDIKSHGAVALLDKCTKIRTISLNRTGIYDVKGLGEALKHTRYLRSLSLAGNYIYGDNVKVLIETIEHCVTLRTLDVSQCCISCDGVKALLEQYKKNGHLLTLDISDNWVPKYYTKVLSSDYCSSLQTVIKL